MNGKHYRPKERTDGLYARLENMLMASWTSQVKNVYDRGYKDGQQDGKEQSDRDGTTRYLKGLNDAWSAAKKLMDMPSQDRDRVFDGQVYYDIIRDRTPSTAISMLERYEKDKEIAEKDSQQRELDIGFAVGNIVRGKDGRSYRGQRLLITKICEYDNGVRVFEGIDEDGNLHTGCPIDLNYYTWTGIHSNFMQFLSPEEESEGEP